MALGAQAPNLGLTLPSCTNCFFFNWEVGGVKVEKLPLDLK